ncbi:unnamed protein product, partial [Didymodactylos carnosus]
MYKQNYDNSIVRASNKQQPSGFSNYKLNRQMPYRDRLMYERELNEIIKEEEKPDNWCLRPGCIGLSCGRSVILFGTMSVIGAVSIGGIFACVLLLTINDTTDVIWKIFGIAVCSIVLITIILIAACMCTFYYKNNAVYINDLDQPYHDVVQSYSNNHHQHPTSQPIFDTSTPKNLSIDMRDNQTNTNPVITSVKPEKPWSSQQQHSHSSKSVPASLM